MKTKSAERLSPAFAGKWSPEVVARKMGLDVDQAEAVVRACRSHDVLLTAIHTACRELNRGRLVRGHGVDAYNALCSAIAEAERVEGGL